MTNEFVKIVEVGPRDGLQNETKTLSIADRIELIRRLVDAGAKFLEGGSFVSPKAIPQMADSELVLAAVKDLESDLSFLVPNLRGLARALDAEAKSIAVFTATSNSFNQKNIGMSVADSLQEIKSIILESKKLQLRVRGYVSTAFGCPYEGAQSSQELIRLVNDLFAFGCDEVSVGDTIGVAHPRQVKDVLQLLSANKSILSRLAFHFHDTRGMAIANIQAALDLGVRIFDSSIGGLGGCPYAQGSSGNVATEEVVWLVNGYGFQTGFSLEKLMKVAQWIEEKVERPLKAKLYLSKPKQFYYFSA